jgi:hypothetical protein
MGINFFSFVCSVAPSRGFKNWREKNNNKNASHTSQPATHNTRFLEHSLGLLLIRLYPMSLPLIEVLALSIDEHLLILPLSFRLTHHIPKR